MTRQDVKKNILPELEGLFGRPFGVNDEQNAAALKAYLDGLQGFDLVDLMAGWKSIREVHAGPVRPSIALIRSACLKSATGRNVSGINSSNWTLKDWHAALTDKGSGYKIRYKEWPNMPGPNPWEYRNTEIPQEIRDTYEKQWRWLKCV